MINQNELRIGNLVMGKHLSVRNTIEVYKIARVNWNGSIMVENRIGRFEEDMEDDITPIPLTEEWLMKCGFVNEFTGHQEDDVMRLQIKKNFMIDYDLNYMQLAINQEGDIVDVDHIKYVHQLQNLHFALTGQELNIEI